MPSYPVMDIADWERVVRMVTGELPSEQIAEVRQWVEGDPERRRVAAELMVLHAAGADATARWGEWNLEGAWGKIVPPDAPTTGRKAEHANAERKRGRRAVPLAAAFAGGLVVAVVGAVVFRNTRPTTPTTTALREYVTRAGQRETVTLSDGTQLTLAPASRVRLSSDYGRPNRDVMLDGQAVFAVVHDAQHRFTVQAKGVVTTDVGTRFGVRAYIGEAAVRVAVADGRVSMTRRGGLLARGAAGAESLTRGDVATITDTSIAITHVASTPDDLAWADGWLALRETPMRDAVADLERWYDIDVRLADPSLATRRITASLHDEPLPKVLSAVALLIDARYEQHGRVVTFYPTRTS